LSRNFLLAFFTPFIVSAIDFRYGYVFAGCNVLGGLLIYFFVLEGQGRTLEELDTMYIQGVLPWKSSEWVAPPPEEIARIRAAAGTGADEEIARAAMNDNIQPAPEKDSLDSDESADHQEKVAEREAEQARENEAAAERRE
jgi:MFS transporter, SP family, sugar:H+ symporter